MVSDGRFTPYNPDDQDANRASSRTASSNTVDDENAADWTPEIPFGNVSVLRLSVIRYLVPQYISFYFD